MGTGDIVVAPPTVGDARAGRTRWLQRREPNPRAKLRLFCFPYAGGAASIYHRWQHAIDAEVEVCLVQLPGRGSRINEPPIPHLATLARQAADALLPYFDRPFAFFGHSMGAMIGFELARHLRESRLAPLPTHLFVSGRSAPQADAHKPPIYNLPEDELFEELRRLNGTPPEVLAHPEIMKLMLPLLRADFQVCDTYVYQEGPPLGCPITAFGGLADEAVTREALEAWRVHTAAGFAAHMLPGDHFFIHSNESALLGLLTNKLRQIVESLTARI
jgi:medium-chain acyl-[acyl-carrier-protein] hydrolase